MPKFSTGCQFNAEEISRHLKKNIGYWLVQMNGNKFATGQILKKTGRSCEGADFSWLSSQASRTLHRSTPVTAIEHLSVVGDWASWKSALKICGKRLVRIIRCTEDDLL